MFVGYPDDTTSDVFHMLNLKTNRIIKSKDIFWLQKTYGEYHKEKQPFSLLTDEDDPSPPTTSPSAPPSVTQPRPTPVPRILHELDTFYNPILAPSQSGRDVQAAKGDETSHVTPPTPLSIERGDPDTKVTDVEEADPNALNNLFSNENEVAAMLIDQAPNSFQAEMEEEEPRNFNAAWNHPDPKKRQQWREAINKEFQDMNARKVWKVIERKQMPKDRRCVKCKWVLKIKRNGVYRARLVACGYSQIPGVDFNEEPYSPVINDVTYRIMMVLSLLRKYSNVLIDVVTAFLHGELSEEEEVYMECPPGMENAEGKVLFLQKTIYGLVQAARAFYKKLSQVLCSIGFEGGYADPCLLSRKGKNGNVYIALYVDDCYCCGDMEEIQSVIDDMKKNGFELKIEKDMTDYLSCKIEYSKDKDKAWIGQPHLMKKLIDKFGSKVAGMSIYKTPGSPHVGIQRPQKDDPGVSKEEHTEYRSGVGMLLYLVKHSRPDIANAVRELSKVMDKPTPYAMKELKRVIKYVIDTKDYGLKMHPNKLTSDGLFQLMLYSDSDWAGDKETRTSVTGYSIFLQGCPISWKSKAQSSVTLSSSEAELMALSEATKEIRFIYELLMSMDVKVKLPIICRVDNVGAIFMSENVTATPKSKNIDTKAKFVTQFVADGFLKVIFVKTAENTADIFTKNVSTEIHSKHMKDYIWKKEDLACLCFHAQQEGCCEVLIENTETTKGESLVEDMKQGIHRNENLMSRI